MNEHNASVIKLLVVVIENLASGEMSAESLETAVSFVPDYIEFQPLGQPTIMRKTVRGTVTTELKLRLTTRE